MLSGASVFLHRGHVLAPGKNPPTYQWQRNGVNLVNGGAVSSATTPTLTINPVELTYNGSASVCLVTNACGLS